MQRRSSWPGTARARRCASEAVMMGPQVAAPHKGLRGMAIRCTATQQPPSIRANTSRKGDQRARAGETTLSPLPSSHACSCTWQIAADGARLSLRNYAGRPEGTGDGDATRPFSTPCCRAERGNRPCAPGRSCCVWTHGGRPRWRRRVFFSDGGITADLRTLPALSSVRRTPGAPSLPAAAAIGTAEGADA